MRHLLSLCATAMAAGCFLSSCSASSADPATPAPSIIESQSIVGLWQKTQEVTVEDEGGTEATINQTTNLFKCILPDGNFILFRAYTDTLTGIPTSRIEMYGTYALQGDTLCQEVITNHCVLPELTGLTSEVHFSLPDPQSMSLYYNLETPDGSAGSSEWFPEKWVRVATK